MARKPRIDAPGALHHVVARGNGRQVIVVDDGDRLAFIRRLGEAIERYQWICWAYCLMDNHFHLMVETPDPNLGRGMQWLKARYAQDFNYRHDRTGHLFGGRYYSVVVDKQRHGILTCLYIPMNPVRAGVAAHPRQWRWSSFRATGGLDETPSFVASDRVLALFSQRPDDARHRYLRAIDAAVDAWGQTRGV